MKFLKLKLFRYRRFLISGIELLEIDFQNKENIILGTNGAGKSSLLYELSPLPAVQSRYSPGGYKYCEISHNGHQYILTSEFNKSQRHDFIKDGVSLNNPKLISIQKELVEQEFGITQEIHDILLDKELFTKMSPTRRKEIFTKLCDQNYDYVTQLYNKIAKQNRELIGYININHKKLTEISSQLIEENSAKKMKDTYEVLKADQEFYVSLPKDRDLDLEKTTQELHDRFEYAKHLETLLNTAVEDTRNKMTAYPTHKDSLTALRRLTPEGIGSILTLISNDIIREKTRASEIQKSINRVDLDLRKVKEEVSEALKRQEMSKEDLIGSINASKTHLNRLRDDLKIKDIENYQIDDLNATQSVLNDLGPVIAELPEHGETKYNLSKLQKAITIIEDTRLTIEKAKIELGRLQTKEEHYKAHERSDPITCPQCSYTWKLQYDQEDHRMVSTAIEKTKRDIENNKTYLSKVEHYRQRANDYLDRINYITQTIKTNPRHFQILKNLMEKNEFPASPNSLLVKLVQYREDCHTHAQILGITQEIDKLENQVNALQNTSDISLSGLMDTKNRYEHLLVEHEQEISLVKENIHHLETLELAMRKLKDRVSETLILFKEIRSLKETQVRAYRQKVINEELDTLLLEITQLKSALDNVRSVRSEFDFLKKAELEATHKQTYVEILTKTLSPTEGLIAKGLIGFINVFTADMNSVINSVWSYPMEIKPSDFDNSKGELSYRFGVKLNDGGNDDPSDISEGSDGMMDIINFAFKIVTLKALKLNGYPLHLDEPGKPLDPVHRDKLNQFIKELTSSDYYTQLFMVSHYAEGYLMFPDADFIVLANYNVFSVPTKANRHVTMR